MDVSARLHRLEELVNEAKSMPLSSSVLVNRDEFLQMISEAQDSLPEEIKQARWIVRDREELLAKARAEGERIVERAREEQTRLARREEIVRRAEEESGRIVAAAEDRAAAMMKDAEDYVDAKLAQFENVLRRIQEDTQATARAIAKTMDQVDAGRLRLRAPGTVAEQVLAPGEPSPELSGPTQPYDDEARA
jgi:F0F1-type ATP synthase membrane subunit b/b'